MILAPRVALLAAVAVAAAAETDLPSADWPSEQRAQYEADAPKTILELQPFRSETHASIRRADGIAGLATLTNLNPHVGSWYLLSIRWENPKEATASYHLENPAPQEGLRLRSDDAHALTVTHAGGFSCTLWTSERAGPLADASSSALPYAPLCSGALYLRNPVQGHRTSLERVTDFLRDHVWGGDQIINFVKAEVYRDAFLVKEGTATGTASAPEAATQGSPAPAALAPECVGRCLVPEHLGLALTTAGEDLAAGQWYGVQDLPAIAVSIIAPENIDSHFRAGHEASVNALDAVESGALVYLVSFDLQRFDLHFVLGTEHPRLDWSDRPPPASRDQRLPGPDGVGSAAPLVTNGMVSPEDIDATVATFAGGFKRSHGAFRFGALAERNHGSHYGFIEQGVIFSKLQPGLATVLVLDDGSVDLKTWARADDTKLPQVKYARQNGVPLIEYDARRQLGVPGDLVNLWGPGNWSGSANEDLRTVRAGLCLQDTPRGRFLIYGYFSAATPSAMVRVFQAYHCSYGMHLDMNALEHTYFALYARHGGQRVVEHLVQGMEAVDKTSRKGFAPRFLAFPDDRDFFYMTRREAPGEP